MSLRSWLIIICGGTILAIALGFRQSLGLFLPHISTDLNIGRESFALGIGLTNLFWGLGAPFTGAIADRFGCVAILVLSGLAYAAGLLIMTLQGTGEQLITGGILLGLAMSGAGFSVIMGVVGRAAPEKSRGLALGIASTLGSAGQFIALPWSHVLIEKFGWSQTLVIMAACSLVIAPLAFGLMNGHLSSHSEKSTQSIREAFNEAIQMPSFWLLNAGFFVCGFQVVFIGVHLPAYLGDKGFSPVDGTIALTLVGLGNVVGSFLCGVLGDIYSRRLLLSGLYFTRSVIISAFILIPLSQTSIYIFSFGIGLLWLGTVPLTSGLIARIFGTTYMSMLFGIVFLSHQIGSFLGSWLAGRFYDMVGNYDAMWLTTILLGVIAGILHLPIRETPVSRLALPKVAG